MTKTPDKGKGTKEKGKKRERKGDQSQQKKNSEISVIEYKTGAKRMLELALLYEQCHSLSLPVLCDGRPIGQVSDHVFVL